MYDAALHCRELQLNYLIEIIGETVEGRETRLRRIAARKIIECYHILQRSDSFTKLDPTIPSVGIRRRW
jgi:hypothetical protein